MSILLISNYRSIQLNNIADNDRKPKLTDNPKKKQY